MPVRAPFICGCGKVVPAGERCPCQRTRDQERKARHDQTRPTARARGYDREWDQERKAFLSVNRECRRCGAPATVVHHAVAHKGDKRLFWNRSNWIPLCKPCHDGPVQGAERRGVVSDFRGSAGTGAGSFARDLPQTGFSTQRREGKP